MGRMYASARSQVELNVGGRHFTTSVSTIRSKPDTMLAAMLRCVLMCLRVVCVHPTSSYVILLSLCSQRPLPCDGGCG
jgi:hypothetical protein